ncbi:RNA exonuclease 4 [Vitis vinifera]|uniref:RNA exonuclease 4 n=1 Tax=Vitis vinifera TaxID=29760 RepID=A0A438E5H5_VITVI|nr:RNA exonuclease 4 [Vitis vinifera]
MGTQQRNPKPNSHYQLNPNWTQLQQKLKLHGSRPSQKSSNGAEPQTSKTILGKRKERPDAEPDASQRNILIPTNTDSSLTDAVAMDCEMVGVGSEGNKSALGRVTLVLVPPVLCFFVFLIGCIACIFVCHNKEPLLDAMVTSKAVKCGSTGLSLRAATSCKIAEVNKWGNVIYDEYVRPVEWVVDFRTEISGIRPRDLKKGWPNIFFCCFLSCMCKIGTCMNNRLFFQTFIILSQTYDVFAAAKDFQTVQRQVAELIKGRLLVGHALRNDLKALLLSHPKVDMRDTSECELFLKEERRRVALRHLAAEFLGVKIQNGEHCPVEDARAAMLLYQRNRKQWEKNIKDQIRMRQKQKKRKQKKKPKRRDASDVNHAATAS